MRRRSLFLLLVIHLLAACESPDGADREAPAFTLPVIGGAGLSGENVALEDLAGDVVVLNFWSTWCSPCRAEHEDLNRLAEAYADKGVRFVGITGDPPREVLAAETKEALRTSYPNLHDRGERVYRAYGVLGVPQHVVIDRDGRIAYHGRGGPIDPAAFGEVLDRVLAGGAIKPKE